MDNKDDPLRSSNISGPMDINAAFYTKYKLWVYAAVFLFLAGIVGYNALLFLSLDSSHHITWVFDNGKNQRSMMFIMVMLLFMFIVSIFARYVFIIEKQEMIFMQQIIALLGFTPVEDISMDTVSGALFSFGHDKYFAHASEGTYEGIPVRLYHYNTTIGSEKQQQELAFTVCEFTYLYHLPHISLSKKDKSINSFGVAIEESHIPALANSAPLKLEGDFNQFFVVATDEGFEVIALEVLTPDVMAILIDQKDRIDLESYGTKLYVYLPGYTSSKEGMATFYENATTLATLLAPHFREVDNDVVVMRKRKGI